MVGLSCIERILPFTFIFPFPFPFPFPCLGEDVVEYPDEVCMCMWQWRIRL